ncbi:MAG: DNA gyrase subunit A [Myxococcota bacterium]|nr:DNA gyrase subunit A [Myxococcota bacterium]
MSDETNEPEIETEETEENTENGDESGGASGSDIGRVSMVTIEDEMRKSYLEYSMSVIVGRALPDIRDGLKPVHRRVLFAMQELSNGWNRPYKKSARVVGDVIGKYHPHGDTAVYDTLVRMAQSFSLRYLLVDGQGNFGSVDGDSAAAMRYTEARMTKLSSYLMSDIDKETVDFGPNYDESMHEPLVLPARFPNLLVNGSEGIAVGMATRIPPHNMTEVINATLHRIDNPSCSIDELIARVPAPDFPTGGILCSVSGAHQAYRTGRGIVHVRARAEFEPMPNDRWRIVVVELPYQVNKAREIERIANLVKDKKLMGISDLRDESDRTGMRMVVELKRDSIKEVVLNALFKQTRLQSSFGINLLAIDQGRPRTCTLANLIDAFIAHRRDVVSRRCRFELRKAREREHILEGFIIALDNIDEVIALIRASRTTEEASAGLQSRFSLSHLQAKAILEMRLQRLTGLESEKIQSELEEIRSTIDGLLKILGDVRELLAVIKADLAGVRTDFGDERRTEIQEISKDFNAEDLIPNHPMVVTVSGAGYIKRTALDTYRTQRRGGRGKTGMSTKEEDAVEHLFVAKNHSRLLVFTTRGVCYQMKVHELPESGANAKGRPIVNLLEHMGKEEQICAILPVHKFQEDRFLVTVTERGRIKKTPLMAYARPRSVGLKALVVEEGDRLKYVRMSQGGDQIILATANGIAVRFKETDVRSMGRGSRGVRGISLREGDQVVGAVVVPADSEADLLSVTANGYGKRTALSEYRVQRRGGKGLITIQCTRRNGDLVGILVASDDRELMMVSSGGIIMRTHMDQISTIGRNTQGVRLIDLDKGMTVVRAVGMRDLEEELVDAQQEGLEEAGEELDESAIAAAEAASDNEVEVDDDVDEGEEA